MRARWLTRVSASLTGSVLLGAAVLAGCGLQPDDRTAGATASPTRSTGVTTPPSRQPSVLPSRTSVSPTRPARARPTAAAPALVTKLVVLVVENHSLDQMRGQMPFTTQLGDRYAYADHYVAARHPSLPNYLALLGGSTFGVRDDDDPTAHRLSGPSVLGSAIAHGRTARLYAEGMPSPCDTTSGGTRYAVKHNPWAYFTDERKQCLADDVSLDTMSRDVATGQLPDAGMIVPDLCHDAHDCDLTTADRWLRERIRLLTSGRDWASGRLAVVVTADEDDHHQSNTVLTAVLQRDLKHRVVHTALTHYSLSRLYSEVLGVPALREAASAPSMASAFGLRVRGLPS